MRLKARLVRLDRRRPPPAPDTEWDDERWLAGYGAAGKKGMFDSQPEFGAALEGYRRALAAAQAQADPPWDPPHEFMPGQADLPQVRLLNWRTASRFPEVMAAWQWLGELLERAGDGFAPVTRAEYDDLAAWFHANEARLGAVARPAERLEVSGRPFCCTDLRYRLSHGPEASGSGRLAEDLRRLRARYGAEGTGPDGRWVRPAEPAGP